MSRKDEKNNDESARWKNKSIMNLRLSPRVPQDRCFLFLHCGFVVIVTQAKHNIYMEQDLNASIFSSIFMFTEVICEDSMWVFCVDWREWECFESMETVWHPETNTFVRQSLNGVVFLLVTIMPDANGKAILSFILGKFSKLSFWFHSKYIVL